MKKNKKNGPTTKRTRLSVKLLWKLLAEYNRPEATRGVVAEFLRFVDGRISTR